MGKCLQEIGERVTNICECNVLKEKSRCKGPAPSEDHLVCGVIPRKLLAWKARSMRKSDG